MTKLRARVLPLLPVLVVALAACGGGSSDAGGDAAPTTTQPAAEQATTTTEASTTTTEVPEADDETKAEAASRILAADAFPDGWTEVVEPPAYATEGIKVDECINPEGGPLSEVPLGAAVGGPTMRAPEVDYFVGSWAVTFADEAQATAYAEQLAADGHGACLAESLQAAGAAGRDDYAVELTSAPAAERGVGQDKRVAANSFELSEGGEVLSTLYIDSFQIWRTIVTVNLELGPMTQEQADAASAVEADLRAKAFA
jgi:hypothetical protein